MASAATTSTTMGCYLHGPRNLRIEERPVNSLGELDVQVQLRSVTLCGSDVHYHRHYRNGSIQVREPLCLGHEAAGIVTAVGSSVRSDLKVGDAVALECGIPCGACDLCHNGRYNVCPQLRFRSSGSKFPHFQGTLQQSVIHPAHWVHKLDLELSCDVGALLEPLAVTVQAERRSRAFKGSILSGARDTNLIFGAGAIGLLYSLAAQAEGSRDIVMVDIDAGRLDFALKNGYASAIYQVPITKANSVEEKKEQAKETAKHISELIWPDGESVGSVQRTIECTGVESCLLSSIYATRNGGTVVLVGMGQPDHILPISDISSREINLIPTWRYANCYPKAIEIAKASVTGTPLKGVRLPNIEKLITHTYDGLAQIEQAFEYAGRTRDDAGKLILKVAVHPQ
ncbi:uncharacterized protein PV09_08957 [Verruconis gallopava]|uniref:Enoyl reductase (ER) domain-containing protein n=1 Tax=Verruconis gallopava TaxID=253628 RepID=A0A0D1ZZC5_9PEZI|nr:uncharacterized protein PV09_08957 [Verruconis gallopava]KIV99419.1 hypothetical protein PV09_08957 [Verruconis gallopava]